MNKVDTKGSGKKPGLPTPPYRVIRRGEAIPESSRVVRRESHRQRQQHRCLCLQSRRRSSPQAADAIRKVLAKHESALVEQFIDGVELTVGLLEEKPLAPIRIVPKREFFDYEAKYNATGTEHRFDTGLPSGIVENCRELARRANDAVGARDLARVDIMLDSSNNPFLSGNQHPARLHPKKPAARSRQTCRDRVWPAVDRLVRRAEGRKAVTSPA